MLSTLDISCCGRERLYDDVLEGYVVATKAAWASKLFPIYPDKVLRATVVAMNDIYFDGERVATDMFADTTLGLLREDPMLMNAIILIANRTRDNLTRSGVEEKDALLFAAKYPLEIPANAKMVSELFMVSREAPKLRDGLRVLHKHLSIRELKNG